MKGRLLVGGLCLCALIDFFCPPALDRAQKTSPQVVDRDENLLATFLTPDGFWRLDCSVKDVDPNFMKELLLFEDRFFYYHLGVNPFSLARAFGQWIVSRKVISGGSTLTMQVVRLLEPRPRTLLSKIIESFRAIQLELHYSKKDILELYLRLAPYGGNLEGLKAATLFYFGKSPRHLSPSERAFLIALPQSPTKLKRSSDRALLARNKVLNRLDHSQIIQEPLRFSRSPFPFYAAHLSQRLAQKRTYVKTTLSLPLQQKVESLVKEQLKHLDPFSTIATLVMDHKTGEVLSYVGSGDFFDTQRQGQVDILQCFRSPGSTLKPLIYAMGFSEGLIHPKTLIADRLTPFGAYRPVNFNEVFHGEVTIEEALTQSLNVPAVAILERIGPDSFLKALKRVSLQISFPPHTEPSLPIALGGCGITPWDLAALYTAFPNGGRVQFPFVQDAKGSAKLLPEKSATTVHHILQNMPPPPGLVRRDLTHDVTIAYKTGTSYGFRDALAVGYNGRYLSVVWVGRPDGTPSPGRLGRQGAAPLLFKILDLVPAGEKIFRPPEEAPQGLKRFEKKASFFISFPTKDMILLQDTENPVVFTAEGGPARWLVNGTPLPDNTWIPSEKGRFKITAVSLKGQSHSLHIDVR